MIRVPPRFKLAAAVPTPTAVGKIGSGAFLLVEPSSLVEQRRCLPFGVGWFAVLGLAGALHRVAAWGVATRCSRYVVLV